MQLSVQFLFGVLTILFSGVGAYVGIKVALAEVKRDMAAHTGRLDHHDGRLDRLEGPYFKQIRD